MSPVVHSFNSIDVLSVLRLLSGAGPKCRACKDRNVPPAKKVEKRGKRCMHADERKETQCVKRSSEEPKHTRTHTQRQACWGRMRKRGRRQQLALALKALWVEAVGNALYERPPLHPHVLCLIVRLRHLGESIATWGRLSEYYIRSLFRKRPPKKIERHIIRVLALLGLPKLTSTFNHQKYLKALQHLVYFFKYIYKWE